MAFGLDIKSFFRRHFLKIFSVITYLYRLWFIVLSQYTQRGRYARPSVTGKGNPLNPKNHQQTQVFYDREKNKISQSQIV